MATDPMAYYEACKESKCLSIDQIDIVKRRYPTHERDTIGVTNNITETEAFWESFASLRIRSIALCKQHA